MSVQYLLRKLFFIIIILISATPCFAEIAILPYKINSPSKYFPISTGVEYSRLLFVASNFRKEIPLASPRDLELDLKRLKIDPQGTITQDHIMFLADQYKIEYVVMGKLSRTRSGYLSESILYSIDDKKVVLRIKNNATDLFKLCELDTINLMKRFDDRIVRTSTSSLDMVVLIDTSYSMYHDIGDIKNAIVQFASLAIDTNRVNSQFFIVPFSSGVSFDKAFYSSNSITGLKKGISRLMVYGRGSSGNFVKSLNYSLNNTNWRENSKKRILIFSNSNLNGAKFIERYSLIARKKKIIINTFSFGKLSNDESESIIRLSTMTGGKHYNVAYYQKLFDAEGETVNLYMQNGRLFKTNSYYKEWFRGLYGTVEYNDKYARPGEIFEEIFYDSKKIPTTPYNLEKQYMKISMDRIINKRKLKSNIAFLIKSSSPKNIINDKANVTLGRALLTDGKISIWVNIEDTGTLSYFEKKERIKDYFYTGLTMTSDDSSVYGLRFQPVMTGLSLDELPEKIVVPLRDLIKKKNYYLNNGLFFPPAWFVRVKVGQLNKFSKGKDLRD